MADLQAAYVRTAAGLEEIRARAHLLTAPQRNLLIVLDGKSTLDSFAKIVGCAAEQMGEVVEPLVRLGLIAVAGGGGTAAPAHPPASVQALVLLAERIFGAGADPIKRKLEKAGNSPAELLSAAEGAAKLAKLTIDESKAQAFLVEARQLISGQPGQNP